MKMYRMTNRDWELLSAYLDRELPAGQQTRLETRLQAEPELRQAYEDLRRTRAALRSLGVVRAPRNYYLKPQMVAQRRPVSKLSPAFGWVSAVATLLLVLVLAGDFLNASRFLLGGLQSPAPRAMEAAGDQAVQPFAVEEVIEAPALEAQAEEEMMAMVAPETEEAAAPAAEALPESTPTEYPAEVAATEVLTESQGVSGTATDILAFSAPEAAPEDAQRNMITETVSMTGTVAAAAPVAKEAPAGLALETPVEGSAGDVMVEQTIELESEVVEPAPGAMPEAGAEATQEWITASEGESAFSFVRVAEAALGLLALLTGMVALFLRYRGR
jgi:hypothetical protein